MIIAIEGPSAAGKTTWCHTHCGDVWVEETPANIVAPDLYDDPAEVGRFWVGHNVANWQRALAIERDHGIAVCDGDPFHLYFAWAMWKAGALERKLFDIESELYRQAFEEERIGFVDLVLWLEAPADELRRRAKADTTRRRKRHEIYLAMAPWMRKWFAAREQMSPGTVLALTESFRIEDLSSSSLARRYDVTVMKEMVDRVGR